MKKDDLYFIQSDFTGMIKIGRSKDPQKRLKQLQTGNPNRLKLIASFKGKGEEEKYLHESICLEAITISNSLSIVGILDTCNHRTSLNVPSFKHSLKTVTLCFSSLKFCTKFNIAASEPPTVPVSNVS